MDEFLILSNLEMFLWGITALLDFRSCHLLEQNKKVLVIGSLSFSSKRKKNYQLREAHSVEIAISRFSFALRQ